MSRAATTASGHLVYRRDIDGLRAVAVAAVVAYHAFPGLLPGGFVGVDVFFVISGFLISSIIIAGLDDGSFTFGQFYARRIRRIFPALAVVLAVTLLLGWFFLFPAEFRQLGRHVFAGAGFVSNLLLWRETGYFDAAAEAKPLLHLWSLGIEEQFYLVFPVAMVVLWRFKRGRAGVVAAVAALSFAASLYLTVRSPSAAFYLPVSRAWELLAGVLLAFAIRWQAEQPGRHLSALAGNLVSVSGAVLIVLSLILVDKTRSFPGWWAVLPVAGAVLLIGAGSSAWLNRCILGHPAFVFVGLISYPLYLWHWPLLSYWSIVSGQDQGITARLAIVAGSLVLATSTYFLVERPVRSRRMHRLAVPMFSLIVATLAVGGCAVDKVESSTRLGSRPELVPILQSINDWRFPGDGAELAGARPQKVLFIGDSFIEHYYSRVERVVAESPVSYSVVYGGTGGCPPLPGVSRVADPGGCLKVNEAAFELAKDPQIVRVVIGSAWHYFFPVSSKETELPERQFEHDAMVFAEGDAARTGIRPGTPAFSGVFDRLGRIVADLRQSGKEVFIVLPSPISDEFDPRNMIDRWHAKPIRRADVRREDHERVFAPVTEQLRRIAAATDAVLLDPLSDLCTQQACSALDGDEPVYTDTGHIRTGFARDRMAFIDPVLIRE